MTNQPFIYTEAEIRKKARELWIRRDQTWTLGKIEEHFKFSPYRDRTLTNQDIERIVGEVCQ